MSRNSELDLVYGAPWQKGSYQRSSETGAYLWCPHCGVYLRLLSSDFDFYFSGSVGKCDECGKNFKLFDILIEEFAETFIDAVTNTEVKDIILLTGARQTEFFLDVAEGNVVQLDVSAFGVPRTAKILDSSFHAVLHPEVLKDWFEALRNDRGPGYPDPTKLELLDAMPIGDAGNPQKLALFPLRMSTQDPSPTKALIRVIWARRDDVPQWDLLSDACQRLLRNDIAMTMLVACSAIEVGFNRVLDKFLERHEIKGAPARHFRDMHLAPKLDILRPFLEKLCGWPELHPHLVESLKILKGERNYVAHGHSSALKNNAKRDIRRLMISCIFVLHYLRRCEYLLQ